MQIQGHIEASNADDSSLEYARSSVDFLHFGNSLDLLPLAVEPFRLASRVRKRDLESYIHRHLSVKENCRRQLADVVHCFGGMRRRTLIPAALLAAVTRSQHWRATFRNLGCRGFSFRLCANPDLQACQLVPDVNVKFALVVDPILYYPPKVRAVWKRVGRRETRHVENGIAWSMIAEKHIGTEKWWVVLNLQSDVASSNASCIKEVFRGWQRVLFHVMLREAVRQDVTMLAVPPAEKVAAAQNRSVAAAGGRHVWHSLYDETANFFGMRPAQLETQFDIQPLYFTRHTWCSHFFVGRVDRMLKKHGYNC